MSATNTLETAILQLFFNATAIANIADNAASSPLTNLYVSLHTADPGEAGSQTTNETSYGSYARVAVVRTNVGWTVSNPTAVNAAAIQFPTCTSGTPTLTHFGIGSLSSGAGVLYFKGALGSSLVMATNITPIILPSQLVVTAD